MQVRWLTFGTDINPFRRFNPLRPLVHWYNARRMNQYVSLVVDERIAKYQKREDLQGVKSTKSILDLALAAYLGDKQDINAMDSIFKLFAMSQIKLFLFSGHDTTSSSICYLFYVLSNNPTVLKRVTDEHDDVFGIEPKKAGSIIAEMPSLLNQIPYSLAVIKETLRLYPPVSSVRAGEPGFNVTDDDGRQFPTDGFMVWANSHSVQRDPAYWAQPDEFVPERWLAPPGDRLHPVKGAWRPFEYGPRNCIGQELAVLEIKIIMILVLRDFSIKPVYEEFDRKHSGGGVRTVYGQRGYQIQRAQPSDDLPCRVTSIVR